MKKEEKEELVHFQKKKALDRLVSNLAELDNSTYYLPTFQIANIIFDQIERREGLGREDFEILKDLSIEDIHVLLSHK